MNGARDEVVMGMPVTVDIRTAFPPRELDTLLEASFAWLRRVNETFSTYRPDSQISRLAAGERLELAPEVSDVLAACERLKAETDGWFDAYATGGLDPSGYVKGWAVERLSRRLHAAGAVDHCVNAGGDVRVRGSGGPGRPWRIGLRDARGLVTTVLPAHNLAVATSGSYERGAHIVDPHTGQAVTRPGSVSVAGPDLGVADAYATALFAMGPQQTLRFVREPRRIIRFPAEPERAIRITTGPHHTIRFVDRPYTAILSEEFLAPRR